MRKIYWQFQAIYDLKKNKGRPMPKKIIATNENIKKLVEDAIKEHGLNCDLSYIDVSNVTDMSFLFQYSQFNGNINNWDVSHVTEMKAMFQYSDFNGDISKWNVSKVTDMRGMFFLCDFDGDISGWNVSNVTDMRGMFLYSPFSGDISNWKVSPKVNITMMFKDSALEALGKIPAWAKESGTEDQP